MNLLSNKSELLLNLCTNYIQNSKRVKSKVTRFYYMYVFKCTTCGLKVKTTAFILFS